MKDKWIKVQKMGTEDVFMKMETIILGNGIQVNIMDLENYSMEYNYKKDNLLIIF